MFLMIACATNDKKNLFNGHFGDAERYLIVKVTKESIEIIKEVSNDMKEFKEKDTGGITGDPEKAGGVGKMLKEVNVNTILGHKIGPNIINMIKKFAVVVSREKDINKALLEIQKRFEDVKIELNRKEKRKHIVIKEEE